MKNIPFKMKRVYYPTGTKPEIPRGFHADKALVQVAVCGGSFMGTAHLLADFKSDKI